MTAPTCAEHDATSTAAAESAVARWLAARPDVRAEFAALPDGRTYTAVRRMDDALLDAARDLALLVAPMPA